MSKSKYLVFGVIRSATLFSADYGNIYEVACEKMYEITHGYGKKIKTEVLMLWYISKFGPDIKLIFKSDSGEIIEIPLNRTIEVQEVQKVEVKDGI